MLKEKGTLLLLHDTVKNLSGPGLQRSMAIAHRIYCLTIFTIQKQICEQFNHIDVGKNA